MKTKQTLLELVQLRGDVLLKLVIILFMAQMALAQHHTAVKAKHSAAGAEVRPAIKLSLSEDGRIRRIDGRELSILELSRELSSLTNRLPQPAVGIYLKAPDQVPSKNLYEIFWAVQNVGGSAYVSLIGGER